MLARLCFVAVAASAVGCTDHSDLVLLSQTASTAIEDGLFCGPSMVKPPPYTVETSFYRVFDLREHGIRGAFRISDVSFAVHTADAAGEDPTQRAELVFSEFRGVRGGDVLDQTQLFPIATVGIAIPNIAPEESRMVRFRLDREDNNEATPINIPDHVSVLSIEVHSLRSGTNDRKLVFGTTTGAESTTAYMRCPDVDDLTMPTSVTKRHANDRVILQLTGYPIPSAGAGVGSRPPGGWLLPPVTQRDHAVGRVVIGAEPDDGVDPADRGVRDIEDAKPVVGE